MYTSAIKISAGYRIIGLIAREIMVSGMRIALAGELKSIKMLVDPENYDPIDTELLSILEDPGVKLAVLTSTYIQTEIMSPYSLIYVLDDLEVLNDDTVETMACMVYGRFIFWRRHHRRRDCYINFRRVLQTAQRVLYEWCKLMLKDEVNDLAALRGHGYRCNYSPGRLKALITGRSDHHIDLAVALINRLKEAEIKASAMIKI